MRNILFTILVLCVLTVPSYAQENESWYNGNWEHTLNTVELPYSYHRNATSFTVHPWNTQCILVPAGGLAAFPTSTLYPRYRSIFNINNGQGVIFIYRDQINRDGSVTLDSSPTLNSDVLSSPMEVRYAITCRKKTRMVAGNLLADCGDWQGQTFDHGQGV